jgi:hypothetical protein
MGVDTWVRDFLISRYHGAFSFDLVGTPTTCTMDFMQFVKSIPDDIHTLNDLVGYFTGIIMGVFSRNPSIMRLIVCVDRTGIHSPVKGMVTHVTRYKRVDVLDPDKGPYLPSDETGKVPKPWLGFAASGLLLRRELYPRLFNAIIGGVHKRLAPGKSIILHGFPGRSEYQVERAAHPYEAGTSSVTNPIKQVRLWKKSELPITADDEARDKDLYNRIYFVEHVAPCPGWPQGMIRRVEWTEGKNAIGEADLAIMHYDHHFPNESHLIFINDGDAFPIMLLYSIERHMSNNSFRNQHFLCLPYKKKKGNEFFAEGHVPRYQYVDMNQLYCKIKDDKEMLQAGVQNRILTMVFLIVMSGTDFFKNHMKGIGAQKTIWATFLSKMDVFSHLVQMPKGVPPGTRQVRDIVLDEDAFRQFVHYCYLEKYGKTIRKALAKTGGTLTYDVLASKCASLKRAQTDPKYRLPTRNAIRVWSRQVLWNLLYWKNGPMGKYHAPDPFEEYDGLPYFGYAYNEDDTSTSKYVMAGYVSARQKPVDEMMAQHLFRNKETHRMQRRREDAQDEVEKVAQKQKNIIEGFGGIQTQ